MESFEHIVGLYLQEKNYWIRHSVKVDLTVKERAKLGKNKISIPRPEIDIVAYNRKLDELLLIEVKSYLDSDGVKIADLSGKSKLKGRYRLLNNPRFQRQVTKNLRIEFKKKGLITDHTKIRYGLAAGKVQKKSLKAVERYLNEQHYIFFSPEDIRKTIQKLAETGWFDDIVVMVAKLTNPDRE